MATFERSAKSKIKIRIEDVDPSVLDAFDDMLEADPASSWWWYFRRGERRGVVFVDVDMAERVTAWLKAHDVVPIDE